MPLGVTGEGGVPGMPGGGVGKAGQGSGLTGDWFQTKPGGGGNPECKLPPEIWYLGFRIRVPTDHWLRVPTGKSGLQ